MGLALVLLLLGFLASASLLQERLRERELPSRRHELQALVEKRQGDVQELAAEVSQLSAELSRLEEEAAQGSQVAGDVFEELQVLRELTGLEPLRGPGIVVELSDSDRAATTREETTDLRIQDVDLQLVVNVLWRAGAEAVAVNGRRVVSTTAIRSAGGRILVNYGAVTSPYRVVAIGDPVTLRSRLEGSEIAERFAVWIDVYGLGFSVDQVDTATVPALGGVRGLEWARPEGDGIE